MNPSSPALEARDICFSYQEGTQVLDNVHFCTQVGQFVALLASNGSGKTTMIKILVGLLKPSNGQVFIHGKNIRDLTTAALYQQVGLVLQNPVDQLFAPTVEEDVAFGPRNLGLAAAEVSRRVDEALAAVRAEPLRRRAVHHLSFGEQKRVSLAGVLAMRPSILVLDEPTAGLDPLGEKEMIHLLDRLNREQRITIVMATHSIDLLPLFADRIHVLSRGKVLKEGTPEEVFADHRIVEQASLRVPYVSRLLQELRHYDGVPIKGLPLTISEAREQIMGLIPPHLIMETITGKVP